MRSSLALEIAARYGGITQDEYDKKEYELKQRQYELNDKLKRVIEEADESYSITLINLLNICSRAYELFESSKVEQKRQLVNFLLSNLKLRGKILEFELKKPFDVLVNLDYRSNWLSIVVRIKMGQMGQTGHYKKECLLLKAIFKNFFNNVMLENIA